MIFGNPEFSTSFLAAIVSEAQLGVVGQCSVQVYKSAVPDDAAALNFDPATRLSDLMGTFTNCAFSAVGNAIAMSTFPAAITTPVAGTITWAYIKGQNGIGIVVEAGLVGSAGALLLDKVVCTAGGSLSVVDAGLSLTFY